MIERAELEAALRAIGEGPDEAIDLGEAALLLAALDRPRVDLAHYRARLDAFAEDVARKRGEDDGPEVLASVLAADHGYGGDDRTYDDPQNANLMRVIDRRKGLPVTLGILYIDVARRAGLAAEGINFPAHFLIRVQARERREILDPFDGGRTQGIADLRRMIKRFGGEEAELTPQHSAPAEDRGVLLRLLNNLRSRALQTRELERAGEIARRMVMVAPLVPLLNRELALITASSGEMDEAMQAAERYLLLAEGERQSHDAASLLQRLRTQTN